MELYHGSVDIVRMPKFGYGHKRNDYGLGFYCTEDKDLAKEWAVQNNTDGYVNKYWLDTDVLSLLDLNATCYNSLHWLTILIQNRTFNTRTPLAAKGKEYLIKNFAIDYEKYDLIYGYRADDSYFAFAQDFLSGTISLRQLSNAMYFGNLGNQLVLKSRKAFDAISFLEYEEVKAKDYYSTAKERDLQARHDYLDVEKHSDWLRDDIFIADILRERMDAYDPRLQRFVPDECPDESGIDDGFFGK